MADNDFMTGYVAGQNEGGRGGGGGFMDGAGSWVWILVIFALLFGWGGNGAGWNSGGGSGGGGSSMIYPYLGGIATRSDISEGFALNNITSGITAIQQGICDSTYALNNTITNGFHGVDRGLCDIGYAIKDCCCTTQRAIDGVNFNMAKGLCDITNVMNSNTRDIIESNNAGTRAVLDFLVNEKLASKDATIADLRMRISQSEQNAFIAANQDAQTAELIRRLGADCPAPAYLVNPPTPVNFPTNGCGTVQFNRGGNYGGCGCGGYGFTT